MSHHLIDEWYKFCSTIGPANPHDFSVSETFFISLVSQSRCDSKGTFFFFDNTSTFVEKY